MQRHLPVPLHGLRLRLTYVRPVPWKMSCTFCLSFSFTLLLEIVPKTLRMMEKAKDKAAETTEKHTGFNALVSGLGIAPVSAFCIVCNTLSACNSPGKTPFAIGFFCSCSISHEKQGRKLYGFRPVSKSYFLMPSLSIRERYLSMSFFFR